MNHHILLFILSFGFFAVGCQSMQKTTEKNKLKADYHIELADNLLRAGKNPAAIQELQTAINLDPTNSVAHHKMALSLYERRRITQSIHHFKESLRFDPNATSVRLDLALVYYETRRYAEAAEQAKIAVNDLTYPAPAQSHYLLGISLFELSKQNRKLLSGARRSFISTLNYSANHCGALYNLGQVYRVEKKPKQAFVVLKKSLESCTIKSDKELALNQLIPLSRQLGLVNQWKSFNQLKAKLAKKP